MSRLELLSKENCMVARRRWPEAANTVGLRLLRILTRSYGFSIASGDLTVLNRSWYVTHSGLLRLAHRIGCAGIHVEPVPEFSNAPDLRWTFKASVYKTPTCRASWATATPIRRTSPLWCTVPRCEWQKLAR